LGRRIIFSGIVSSALLLCAPAAAQWQAAGPWGGSATSVWVDLHRPDTLLAGARNSLVFRSVNGGAWWERLNFPRYFSATISAVMIHPAEPRLYLAAAETPQGIGAGVWYSEDEGATWKAAEGVEGLSTHALAWYEKDPRRMAAATRDGVWKSGDSGRTWVRISPPYNHELRSVTAVAIDPRDDNIIYAGTTHLPWKTTDGGKTWQIIHDGMLDDSDVFSIFIDPARPERVLASACSGIYRSEDGGRNWSRFRGIPPEQRRTHVVRQMPGRNGTIFAGTTLGLLKSTDGGATFRRVNRLHVYSMAFDPRDPRRIYLATEGGGLWKSADAGESFVQINEGFASRRAAGFAVAGRTLYLNIAGDGQWGGLFASPDGGAGWQPVPKTKTFPEGHVTRLAACPSREELLLAGNDERVYRSLDSGRNWTPLRIGGGARMRIQALACVMAAGKEVLLAGTDIGLWRSTDLGATWQSVRLTTANIRHSVQELIAAQADGGRVLARTAYTVYLSADGGANWRVLSMLFPVSSIYDMAITESTLLAATADGMYLSADDGRHWEKVEQGLAPGTVSTLAARPGRGGEVFAGQFGRIYRSTDGGRKWQALEGADLPAVSLRRLLLPDDKGKRLLGLTPDAGVFFLDLDIPKVHNER
jgi:photosystem II stability/assembly factor-like uncharacterized protein